MDNPVRIIKNQEHKTKPKRLIVFDHREPFRKLITDDGFIDDLSNKDILFAWATLPIADISISIIEPDGTCRPQFLIERKEKSDLLATLVSADRVINLETLKYSAGLEHSTPMLLIESFHKLINNHIIKPDGKLQLSSNAYQGGINPMSILGFVNKISQTIPILYTLSKKNSLRALINLALYNREKLLSPNIAVRWPLQYKFCLDSFTLHSFILKGGPTPPANMILLPYEIKKNKKKSLPCHETCFKIIEKYKLDRFRFVWIYQAELLPDNLILCFEPAIASDLFGNDILNKLIIIYNRNNIKSIQGNIKVLPETFDLELLISYLNLLIVQIPNLSQLSYFGFIEIDQDIKYVFPFIEPGENAPLCSMYTCTNETLFENITECNKYVCVGIALLHYLRQNHVNIDSCNEFIPVNVASLSSYLPYLLINKEITVQLVKNTLFEFIDLNALIMITKLLKYKFVL